MSNFGKRGKDNSRAWFISDRSGMRFPMSEHEIEPGTGYMIHRSESDGMWNMVDHPQANLQKWAELSGDPYPVDNARPDIVWSTTSSTVMGDQSGAILACGYITFSLVNTSLIDDYVPWPYSNG